MFGFKVGRRFRERSGRTNVARKELRSDVLESEETRKDYEGYRSCVPPKTVTSPRNARNRC